MAEKCSREMAEIFDEIAIVTIEQGGYEKDSGEWAECERKLNKLYGQAERIAHRKAQKTERHPREKRTNE